MSVILAGICTLTQHLHEINANPEAYRPERCPYCGCTGLWCHGHYGRQSDRRNSSASLNPITVPRFICPHDSCGKSCSVLPECIPPRRWYLWSVQQAVLLLLFSGQLPDEQACPHIRTVWRWWARLKEHFLVHRFYLANRWEQLGQYSSVRAFWKRCFAMQQFSSTMFFIHQHDEIIP